MRWFHIGLGVFLGIVFMIGCSLQQDGEGLVFDAMSDVVAAITSLADEVGFNNLNTRLSADNVQSAIEEADAKAEELKKQLEGALAKIAELENKTNDLPIYSLECPRDMVRVGDHCVELDSREPGTFHDAVATCSSARRRLCTTGEIVGFCQQEKHPSLSDQEWTSTLFVHSPNAGALTTATVGLLPASSCGLAPNVTAITSTFTPPPPRSFRCCSELELIVD